MVSAEGSPTPSGLPAALRGQQKAGSHNSQCQALQASTFWGQGPTRLPWPGPGSHGLPSLALWVLGNTMWGF